ncbi:MAG: hypothetical protein FWE82_03530 [Defluviitaleaceae bacterium]|nr:hypothetical protein [Defluviitaleaceae bacterium]
MGITFYCGVIGVLVSQVYCIMFFMITLFITGCLIRTAFKYFYCLFTRPSFPKYFLTA